MSVCTIAQSPWCVSVCVCGRVCVHKTEREREREMEVFLRRSSGLSFPHIRHWLDPAFSHDALQAETLEILQAMAKRHRHIQDEQKAYKSGCKIFEIKGAVQ